MAKSLSQVIGGYGQRKGGGNADAPADPVRAHSYDVDDQRAKPHRPIGDGTPGQRWAFARAQLDAVKAHFNRQRDEGYGGEFRLQASHLYIYEVALKDFLFGETGEFIFSATALAKASRHGLTTVKECIMVLEHWGFLCHVRRSRKVEERDGEPGWERVTAPNAYYFDCEARMPKEVWQDFWKALVSNLKRVATIAARAATVIKAGFNSAAKPAPRAQNTELRMLLDRMADGINRRDQALSPPPSPPAASTVASSERSPWGHYPGTKA